MTIREHIMLILIAIVISLVITWFDLLASFPSMDTIRRGWIWVFFYCCLNVALAAAFYWVIRLSGRIDAPDWLLAIIAGFMFPTLLKNRLFAAKMKEAGEPFNPEITYQQMAGIIKRRIAFAGLRKNMEKINDLRNLGVEELQKGIDILFEIEELWTSSEEKTKAKEELDEWMKEYQEDKQTQEGRLKIKLSGFLLKYAPVRDLNKIISEEEQLRSRIKYENELFLSLMDVVSSDELMKIIKDKDILSRVEEEKKEVINGYLEMPVSSERDLFIIKILEEYLTPGEKREIRQQKIKEFS